MFRATGMFLSALLGLFGVILVVFPEEPVEDYLGAEDSEKEGARLSKCSLQEVTKMQLERP